jgi:hypothetical protein
MRSLEATRGAVGRRKEAEMRKLLTTFAMIFAIIAPGHADPAVDRETCYGDVPPDTARKMVQQTIEEFRNKPIELTLPMEQVVHAKLRYNFGRYIGQSSLRMDGPNLNLKEPRWGTMTREKDAIAAMMACFPELGTLIAMQQAARAEYNRPVNKLFRAYELYSNVDFCHQHRQGYAYIWINDVEKERARTAVKALERAALAEQADLDTDYVWQKALQAAKGTSLDGNLCQEALHTLLSMSPVSVYKYEKP